MSAHDANGSAALVHIEGLRREHETFKDFVTRKLEEQSAMLASLVEDQAELLRLHRAHGIAMDSVLKALEVDEKRADEEDRRG